jgi:NAD+-dependent protein deacetylase sirtuin 4
MFSPVSLDQDSAGGTIYERASPTVDLQTDVAALLRFAHQRCLCVLTGAGCSTESGIPDYRGPETRRRARNPIRMDAFLRNPETRKRYWARSFVGFPRMRKAEPNRAHHALCELEERGSVNAVLTQNVDGLHSQAGSRELIELHGSLSKVRCLDCGATTSREAIQNELFVRNPHFEAQGLDLAPDGDADIPAPLSQDFNVPDCEDCGGVLKPHVVFFGDNVPAERVDAAYRYQREADALLVVGSSLAVFSGYRFVKRAQKLGMPVAILNLTETRGDAIAELVIRRGAGDVLASFAEHG